MTAYDYPVLGAFWTMLIFFIFIAWLMLLFRIIFDIFRSHDMGGFAKAFWLIFIIILPFLGVFIYLIARGTGMAQRDMDQAKAQQEQFDSYVRDVAAPTSSADELAKLSDLHTKGVITDAEFQAQKAKLLA
jgi:hypothetical protein